MGVGWCTAGRCRVQHPLRYQIRESAIGCSRVHVVRDSQAEMARFPAIAEATLENVDARAEELDDGQRKVGEMLRIGRPAT